MKIIGITGGVGAGKTQILTYIKHKYNCRILEADKVAHKIEEPGQLCYKSLIRLLGRSVLSEDGFLDKKKMAAAIFDDEALRLRVNELIHPAVKQYILHAIETERSKQMISYFFIEAALLIEDGYVNICDELWYIYTEESVRRERLKNQRGYSDEKINAIMNSQLSESEFRKYCRVVINNSVSLEDAYIQIDRALEER